MDRAENKSEVARLREEIDAILFSMKLGQCGYAEGVSRHDFIQTRLRRLDTCHQELQEYLGDSLATRLLFDSYHTIIENNPPSS